ncbi:MAG: STAS domain-containing protein [Pseudomonadota bacterium]
MTISTTEYLDGKGVKIKINGRFEFSQHQQFREAYAGIEPEKTSFIIDLTEASYMDSAALGMLLVLRERAGGINSDITLSGYNHVIRQIIEISHFKNLFKLERSRAA